MKYSQFNSVIPFEEKFVLFNTYTNNLIAMDPLLNDLLIASRHEGIDNLVDIHPGFYEALLANEFLVNEATDEVETIKRLRDYVDYNERTYHLTINPTMNCNFECWYCYETHVKASRMNEDIIDRVNRFLTAQLHEGCKIQKFTLSWFGGEPLLYFYDIVLPIIKHFNQLTQAINIQGDINFTSNGFLINDKMASLFRQHNVGG